MSKFPSNRRQVIRGIAAGASAAVAAPNIWTSAQAQADNVIFLQWTMTMMFTRFPSTPVYGCTKLTLHEDGRIIASFYWRLRQGLAAVGTVGLNRQIGQQRPGFIGAKALHWLAIQFGQKGTGRQPSACDRAGEVHRLPYFCDTHCPDLAIVVRKLEGEPS